MNSMRKAELKALAIEHGIGARYNEKPLSILNKPDFIAFLNDIGYQTKEDILQKKIEQLEKKISSVETNKALQKKIEQLERKIKEFESEERLFSRIRELENKITDLENEKELVTSTYIETLNAHFIRHEEMIKNFKKQLKQKQNKISNEPYNIKPCTIEKNVEPALQCPVCLDSKRNTVLTCTHTVCLKCSEKLTTCPICRAKIIRDKIVYFRL